MARQLQAQVLSIQAAYGWYTSVVAAIHFDQAEQRNIAKGLSSSVPRVELVTLTLDEIDSHYQSILDEHEALASLGLLAAAEAIVRVDYQTRAREKRADLASMRFRTIYRDKKERARMKEELLGTWKEIGNKNAVGELTGAINYRNWLAHGRYWHPGIRNYDIESVVTIIS